MLGYQEPGTMGNAGTTIGELLPGTLTKIPSNRNRWRWGLWPLRLGGPVIRLLTAPYPVRDSFHTTCSMLQAPCPCPCPRLIVPTRWTRQKCTILSSTESGSTSTPLHVLRPCEGAQFNIKKLHRFDSPVRPTECLRIWMGNSTSTLQSTILYPPPPSIPCQLFQ